MKPQITADEMTKIHNEVISLFKDLLIPFMEVQRDIPFSGAAKRHETDAEHIFSLAMVALSLEERLGLNLDRGMIAQYALIHDLVEAYAGDVSAKAEEHLHAAKAIDEAKALQAIQDRYSKVYPWISNMCVAYEQKTDAESKFVYSVDKLMGAYTWLAGDLRHWDEYYPADKPDLLAVTIERLRKKISDKNIDLVPIFDSLHDVLSKKLSEQNK